MIEDEIEYVSDGYVTERRRERLGRRSLSMEQADELRRIVEANDRLPKPPRVLHVHILDRGKVVARKTINLFEGMRFDPRRSRIEIKTPKGFIVGRNRKSSRPQKYRKTRREIAKAWGISEFVLASIVCGRTYGGLW